MAYKKQNRLLFILSFPPPYHGANISNQILWNSKIQEQYDCKLLDISDKRDLNNLGVFDFVNIALAIKHTFLLIYYLIFFKPHAVYMLIAQNKWAYLRDATLILIIKTFSSAKVIGHLRGAFFDDFYNQSSILLKRFINWFQPKVDVMLVLGETLKNLFEKWNAKIYVVPNGTNLLLDNNLEEKFQRGDDVINILYLSNLFESKGILELAKAIKFVKDRVQHKTVVYNIAGAYGKDPKLNKSAEEIKRSIHEVLERDNTKKDFNYLGVVTGKNKESLLKKSDIFVLPTFYDGHPRSILEAMAAGCPVISTSTGAIPDTVIDDVTGYIIPYRNVEALASKIKQLVINDELRIRMGKAARKRYIERYTEQVFINNMIGIFEKVLNNIS